MNTLSNTYCSLSSLLRSHKLDHEQIKGFRNRQLRRLVHHAYENVPYYREMFDAEGLRPGDIRTEEDLSAVPITSKKDLQIRPPKELVARGIDPESLVFHMTGGSTGEPMVIRRTWIEERLLQTFRRRSFLYFGVKMRDRAVIISASDDDHNDNRVIERIFNSIGLYREKIIDCRQPLDEIVKRLQSFEPDILRGYPGVLHKIADLLNGNGCDPLRPRFVAVGGEVLTPLMRERITKAFEARVFDIYGSSEFNLIAWECKETGSLHVCDDAAIVEVIHNGRPAREGERGEVVATGLHSFSMPFIRFRLDDMVTKGSPTCECGAPFSTISRIEGRVTDYFLLPEGRLLHPWEFIDRFYMAPWIRQYRLIQERENRVILQIAPFLKPPEREIEMIKKYAVETMGESVEFRVDLVNEIELEPNGKLRTSCSFVNPGGAGDF